MNYTACEVSRAVSGLILNHRNNTLEYQESYIKKIIRVWNLTVYYTVSIVQADYSRVE